MTGIMRKKYPSLPGIESFNYLEQEAVHVIFSENKAKRDFSLLA